MTVGKLLRWRLVRWIAILTVALGVVAMHQLSVGHMPAIPAAADTTLSPGHPMREPGGGTTDHVDQGTLHRTTIPGQPARTARHGQPPMEHSVFVGGYNRVQGGCVGCGGDGVMVADCLAALVLLIASWLLPALAGRGIVPGSQMRHGPLVTAVLRRWQRRPPRLVELSISLT